MEMKEEFVLLGKWRPILENLEFQKYNRPSNTLPFVEVHAF